MRSLGVVPLLALLLAARGGAETPRVLPDMGELSPFALVDTDGRRFSSASLRGRMWVLDFIYTSCTNACPRMSRLMQRVQDATATRGDVTLVTVTVDPKNDTPAALGRYARAHGARPDRWIFLTGDERPIAKLQQQAAGMGPQELLAHNKCFFLVDADGFVRGDYRSRSDADVDDLLRDIEALRVHPARPLPAYD